MKLGRKTEDNCMHSHMSSSYSFRFKSEVSSVCGLLNFIYFLVVTLISVKCRNALSS